MASSILRTRKQKLDAWINTERITQSWLNYLESVPKNKAMTEGEWYKGWREHVRANANSPAAVAVPA